MPYRVSFIRVGSYGLEVRFVVDSYTQEIFLTETFTYLNRLRWLPTSLQNLSMNTLLYNRSVYHQIYLLIEFL